MVKKRLGIPKRFLLLNLFIHRMNSGTHNVYLLDKEYRKYFVQVFICPITLSDNFLGGRIVG